MGNSSTHSFADDTHAGRENDGIGNNELHEQKISQENEGSLKLGPQDAPAWSAGFGEGEMENMKVGGGVDPVFEAKAAVVNAAFQHIGMGKYQWKLFALCGFGWAADNLWLQGVAIILPQVGKEFNPPHQTFLTLALYTGLIVGASFWGIGADLMGRQLAFNLTLFIASVFGTAAGGASNFVGVAAMIACVGLGTGGNLPVDGAIFLEFVPGRHQFLLTILSVWWCVGQVVASVIAWGLIGNYSCETSADCTRENNMGWRYTLFTMGAITFLMFFARFLVFHLFESPKYLLGQGHDEKAVEVVAAVAKHNGTTSPLTIEHLREWEMEFSSIPGEPARQDTSFMTNLRRAVSKFSLAHVKALWSTPRLAYSTTLVVLLWGIIGLAYPLYNAFLPIYLANAGAQASSGSVFITYRNYVIISVCGIPGSVIAGFVIEWRIGRKGVMSAAFIFTNLISGLSTILTGVFLFLFVATARTDAAILGFNCATALTQNVMYGVLYAYTPEILPSVHRGTGSGIAACFNRICGLMAPIIGAYVGTSGPTILYVSASLFLVAGILIIFLPYESRGKASI